MPIHFEDLWVQCEKLHEESVKTDSISSLLDELAMKLNLYRIITDKPGEPSGELQKMKERAMGEVLLTLTKISIKENINVYEALSIAAQFHSIVHYSQKYPV
jgi:hypothetical protein